MSQTPLRIAFVGGGFISRFHIRSLLQVRDCVVTGVASRTRESAEGAAALARELGVGPAARAYESVEALTAASEVDALWICARNDTRLSVMEAVLAGATRRATPLRGIAIEKPLARNLAEGRALVRMLAELGVPCGYLEDMLWAPPLLRAKEVLWRRGAACAGRPYLARAAEEHAGPHSAWFWQPEIAGGGVLLDMMCHSVEAARWLLTEPGAPRASLVPVAVNATCACLKWSQPRYAALLRERFGPAVDWERHPAEDFARATIRWRCAAEGRELLSETTSSWCYVGAGLRHRFELLGPEYALDIDLSRSGTELFFSRAVVGAAGEDLVEKQNAEQGLMPLSPDEPALYGYVGENRHMVEAFRADRTPSLGAKDGLEVLRLLMAAYRSAECGAEVDPFDPSLESFLPHAARPIPNPTPTSKP